MMPARKRPAARPKHIRSQPRDPVTGERRSIYAASEAERDARLLRLGEVRRDVRYGMDPAEAARAARPALGRVLTVDEAWSRYLATKPDRAQRRINVIWSSYICPYLSGRRAWELSPDVMARWVLDLGKTRGRTGHGLAPATIWLCYDSLAAACNRLVPRDLPALPWGRWRPDLPKGPDSAQTRREYATTVEQLCSLVLAARERDAVQWDRGQFSDLTARVVVLLLTGLRQAEAAGLAWDNITLDAPIPMLYVWAQAPQNWRRDFPGHDRPPAIPKGRKRRKQVAHPNVVAALLAQREQLQARGWFRPDGPVFPGNDGQWRSSGKTVKPTTMRELAAAAGLPNPHLWVTHSTRHTFATLEVLTSLGDFRATQARTGHSSIAQLETYYHAATGRGMPQSHIPELGAELMAPAIKTAGVAVTIDLRQGADAPAIERSLPPAPLALPPARPEPPSAASARPAEPATWPDLARDWLASCASGEVPTGKNGRALVRPPEVSEDIRRAARRLYARAKTATWTREECSRRVAASRRAKLAAWSRALRNARPGPR